MTWTRGSIPPLALAAAVILAAAPARAQAPGERCAAAESAERPAAIGEVKEDFSKIGSVRPLDTEGQREEILGHEGGKR
jgi:hypothetical protein